MHISKLKVGNRHELSSIYDCRSVSVFAGLSLDTNPIHLSPEYAAKTFLKQPIVHGMLYASLISAVIANHLPGPGSIYKQQDLTFVAPVFYGEKVTAVVEVTEVIIDKCIIILDTIIYKNDDRSQVVVKGKACVKKIEPL